jgi:hypothetical protein
MSEGGVITVALTVISAIVWAVRVEGIVRSHEQQIAQLRNDMKSEMADMRADVQYIRQRIDQFLGGPGKRP